MIPCSAVQGMGSGLLFCTDSHNKYVMPILNGAFLCFKMCAHVGTYFKVTTILQFYTFFIRSKYITIFISYLLFYVMMMLFYLYICNYVTYIEGHKVE